MEFSLHYINFELAVDAYVDISSAVELNCAEVMEGTGWKGGLRSEPKGQACLIATLGDAQ